MVTVSYPVVWKLLKSLPTRLLPGVATRLPGYPQVVEILTPRFLPGACAERPPYPPIGRTAPYGDGTVAH